MSLRNDLERWVEAGLLTGEQATAVEAFELQRQSAPPARRTEGQPRRIPPVAEALGYLGGTLGIVGLILLIARSWSDLPPAGRLGITAAGTIVFVVAGMFVREDSDPALARLRWFLWLIATGAIGVFGGTVERQLSDDGADARTAMAAAIAVTLLSFALRGTRRRPVQHLTMLGGGVVTVGTTLGYLVDLSTAGLGVWAIGILLVAIGLGRRDHEPLLATVVGAAAAVVGPALMLDQRTGVALILELLTAGTLITLASLRTSRADSGQRIALAVIGGIALFQSLPSTIGYFAADAGVTTGLVMWACGWLLVIAAPHRAVRATIAVMAVGGIATIVGAAVAGTESVAVATALGLVTSVALLVVGSQPGRVVMSGVGSIGLLVFVPWSIAHFFPGEGRAPLLIFASGVVIVVVAVMLSRLSGRFRHELRRRDVEQRPA
jgi:hypothetical protein